uniref:Ribosomal protein L34e superfamily protein n=1 Tax=Davidia involucrata TaxID=16924 RepID=A0A5B7B8X3_DAVIN
MRLPMVDCRSLIEFCKAFEQHKNMANSLGISDHRTNHNHSRGKKHGNPLNPLAHPFCDHSPLAAVDVIMLLLVLGALGFLILPYFKFIFHEASEVLPTICDLVGDVIHNAPVAYVVGLAVSFTGVVAVIAAWEIFNIKSRKCGNPYCKGLRKAVEFDIQLESEECVKYLPPLPTTAYGVKPLELGQDHKELEAELKRMAPLNGRTVLIFRAPCGCPAGRMEVWGPKKIRRIKK